MSRLPPGRSVCVPAGLVLLCILCILAGCESGTQRWDVFAGRRIGGATTSKLPTVTDRLLQTYPELATNRFRVIADFESPAQGQMFSMITPGHGGYAHVSTLRSRRETGAGSLEAHFSGAADVLVAQDEPGADWSLPADWRAYQLLMMSIYSPSDEGTVELAIRGRGSGAGYRRRGILLQAGWNTLRVDLAEVARWVDLGRVAQIRWRPEDPAGPTTLFLDDLILVDNRTHFLGTPSGPTGEPYVTHEGQRIRVGACGRFELVFANGELTEWYDLGNDPTRTRNWANWPSPLSASIGPMAVVLQAETGSSVEIDGTGEPPGRTYPLDVDGARGWSILGRRVQVYQRVLEASPVRTVVECERVFHPPSSASVRPAETPDAPAPGARIVTRYTITPYGRLFVQVDCPTGKGPWQATELGLVFTCSRRGGFEPVCHSAPIRLPGDGPEPTCHLLFARADRAPGTSDLLCVAHDPSALPIAVKLQGGDGDRIGAMFTTLRVESPRQSWALMMVIWPDDIDDAEAAELLALSYSDPPPVRMEVGEMVRTDPGDLNNDGFNESQGCYVVQPEEDRLRLHMEVGEHPCWYPTFKLLGTQGKRLWVYADGEILKTDARAADGSALIVLDRVIDHPVEIEVLVQSDPDSRGS